MSTKQSPPPRAARRICVIFPGALGDFVCFLPALQALARNHPVDLYARREFAEIAPRGVRLDALERPEITRLFRPESASDPQLQRFYRAYERIESWFASGDSSFVERIQALSGGRARLFPFRPPRPSGHQIDYYLDCLRAAADVPRQPAVALRAAAVEWADRYRERHGLSRRPVLVIAPGSGAREKNWPAEYFLAVVDWWRQAVDGTALVLSGPVEEERGGIGPLRRECLVAGGLDLAQTAALLSRSALYLGNDSGVSHLCAALGVRTVVLFGPSDPAQWSPRGPRVTILRRAVECSPCHEPIMKRCPHRRCLNELRPAQIIPMLANLSEVVTLTRYRAGITV
jgi:ADP-heptose:LPS heptosyltransferase